MPKPTISESTLSRRQFLAAAGLSTAAVLGACSISSTMPSVIPAPTTNPSPYAPGVYQTSRIILGEDAGTTAMPLPYPFQPGGRIPSMVKAAVYYPNNTRDHRPVPTPNPLNIGSGPFPVVFYGHAIRTDFEPSAGHPLNRDFTTAEYILRHLASHGFVCVAPDLSWSGGEPNTADWQREAVIFLKYYQYLATPAISEQLFSSQLQLTSVILVGHSHRAGVVTNAGIALPFFQGPKPRAYGLIAPEADGDAALVGNILVIGGTLDGDQGAQPGLAYQHGAPAKTYVSISGANHYGYTDLVSSDNLAVCNCSDGQINLLDENGAIARADQQVAAASYLAALARYHALNDGRMRPYLSGEQTVEGLEPLSIQVQASGYDRPALATRSPINKP